MNTEDFEEYLNLQRQERGDMFDSQPMVPEQDLGKSFQIDSLNIFPSLDTVKQVEGLNEDLSEVQIKDCFEEKKGSWKANTIVFTCYKKAAIDDPEGWLRSISKQCKWVLGQVEKCPTTGRIHIQGMATCNGSDSRWGFLKGEDTWKAKCIAPIASIKYCSKSKSQLQGPWEFGERPVFGQAAKAQKKQEQRKEPSPS